MILDMVDIGVKQVDIVHHYNMPKSTFNDIDELGRVTKREKVGGLFEIQKAY